jgi:hypothetical protein
MREEEEEEEEEEEGDYTMYKELICSKNLWCTHHNDPEHS